MNVPATAEAHTAGQHLLPSAEDPCLRMEADPIAGQHLLMAAAGCRLTVVVAVDAQCHQMVAAEASAEAARLRMAVAAEVTHPPMEGVAVVDVLPAAEAGMPRLRAIAQEAEVVRTAVTTVGTDTTKL